MDYKYTISAEGSVEEETIRKVLEEIGLKNIFIDKVYDPDEIISIQSDEKRDDVPDLWTKIIESEFITNGKLTNAMKEYDASKLRSVRDIAQAISDCCMKLELSRAYTGIVLNCVLKTIG